VERKKTQFKTAEKTTRRFKLLLLLNTLFTSIDVYFVINGVKHWAVVGPSGLMVYVKEGSKSKYLGRKSVAEIKEMLAKADAETLHQIKSDIETIKLALDSRKTAAPQTAQTPPLTWKKDGHLYWLVLYAKTVYIYKKGPETRHRPKLVEKTDINGAIDHVTAAGAIHVLDALRLVINGLHAAVADLLKQAEKTPDEAQKTHREAPHREAQVSRREAEAALRELRRELSRAMEKWSDKWRQEAEKRGYWGDPDREWMRDRLHEFINDYMHLIEKILPHPDLLDKFADAAASAATGYLSRSDVLERLQKLRRI